MDNTSYSYEESEETVSLWDCSLTCSRINNAAEEEEEEGGDCSDQEEHCFEFCSEEWCNSMVSSEEYFSAENIIFCGRIIAAADEPTANTTSPLKLQNLTISNNVNKEETKRNRRLPAGAAEYCSFRWDGSHNQIRRAEMLVVKKKISYELKKEKKRSSWSPFCLIGGIRRFQGDEMVLRDIKSRQNRLGTNPALFRLDNTDINRGDQETMSCGNGGGRRRRRRDRGRPGFWGLWKAVSANCGGQRRRDNSVVKIASAGGCFPRL